MLKKRILSLLLSLVMMLTFMPVMAFAEDAADDVSELPVAAESTETAETVSEAISV